MEFIETFIFSASYLGVIDKLIELSPTDMAVIFLISKPAFIFTAGLMVLTTRNETARCARE